MQRERHAAYMRGQKKVGDRWRSTRRDQKSEKVKSRRGFSVCIWVLEDKGAKHAFLCNVSFYFGFRMGPAADRKHARTRRRRKRKIRYAFSDLYAEIAPLSAWGLLLRFFHCTSSTYFFQKSCFNRFLLLKDPPYPTDDLPREVFFVFLPLRV